MSSRYTGDQPTKTAHASLCVSSSAEDIGTKEGEDNGEEKRKKKRKTRRKR